MPQEENQKLFNRRSIKTGQTLRLNGGEVVNG